MRSSIQPFLLKRTSFRRRGRVPAAVAPPHAAAGAHPTLSGNDPRRLGLTSRVAMITRKSASHSRDCTIRNRGISADVANCGHAPEVGSLSGCGAVISVESHAGGGVGCETSGAARVARCIKPAACDSDSAGSGGSGRAPRDDRRQRAVALPRRYRCRRLRGFSGAGSRAESGAGAGNGRAGRRDDGHAAPALGADREPADRTHRQARPAAPGQRQPGAAGLGWPSWAWRVSAQSGRWSIAITTE